MKKFGLFLGGVPTGVVLTLLVLIVIAASNKTLDGVTNFEIVECPSGKQFRQTGIYQYNTKIGYKTVPIIELK